MTKKPAKQPCTVCGYPRKPVELKEKVGKDGRIARWWEFEKCPNKNDPNLHPSRRLDLLDMDEDMRIGVKDVVKRVLKQSRLPAGIMYQVSDLYHPLEEVASCLLHFEDKVGKLPMAIGVRADESDDFTEIDWETTDGGEETIPIWPMNLSERFGYIFLVIELTNEDNRDWAETAVESAEEEKT